ncbi:hypothetical protein B0H14DRAFT_3477239 [Mycena olivaceomarginata]|nr:hypothetical protein B0H14DRAFT_3477239 [Mycena olivaceomarginata]
MVNNRKSFDETSKSYRKPIRVLHYSTSRPTARWTTVSTIFQNSRADALRYPVVENVCHRDADRQPWIHDFDVTLEHGQKIASFRIFLKRGITLLPNKYSDAIVGDIVIMRLAARDGNKVVNVRSTDRPAANYIFNEALQRMKDFQSKKRICLPPVLELTLEGNPPFPAIDKSRNAVAKVQEVQRNSRTLQDTIEQLQRENAQLLADREEMGHQMAHQAIEMEGSISKHWEGMFQTGMTLLHQSEQLKLQDNGGNCPKEAEAAAKEREAKKQQELEKQKAEYDNKLAAFISRTSFVASAPQRAGPGFPQASPALVPRFIEEPTREQRLVEVTLRTGGTRIPTLVAVEELVDDNMGIPTPANSAPDRSPANGVPNPQRPFESIDWDDPRVSQRVEGMVQTILASMGAKNFGVTTRRRRTRTSKMTLVKMARQQQQGLLTDEEDLKWKELIREVWRMSVRLNRAKDFVDYRPASDEIVKQANEGHLEVDATSPFYFGKGYAAAFYNQRIIDAMVEKALKMRAATENKCGLPDTHNGRGNSISPAWEKTAEQARMRTEAYEAQRATRVLSLSRKTQKLEGRIRVVKKIMHIETAKKSQETAKNWQWILELLEHLGTGGMSSEDDIDAETAVAGKTMITTVHLVKICPWRSEEVTKYLHWIDRTAESTAKPPPPPRVPREIYNGKWLEDELATFGSDVEEELEISKEAFKILKLAVSNLGLKDQS